MSLLFLLDVPYNGGAVVSIEPVSNATGSYRWHRLVGRVMSVIIICSIFIPNG